MTMPIDRTASRLRSRPRLLVAVLAFLLLAGCAARTARTEPPNVDPKWSPYSYVEDGNLVTFLVSTRSARYRNDRAYLPFQVALLNKGLKSLTLTRESFTLVDAGGKRYPLAGRDELVKGYGNTDIDRRFGEIDVILRNKFARYDRVPSNFSPGFDAGIAVDHVSIPRFSYILDFLYFPRPEGRLEGATLELDLNAPELPDPVYVRFTVDPMEK